VKLLRLALSIGVFASVGCGQPSAPAPDIPPTPDPAPISSPPPEGPRWFPENLRPLAEEEKSKATEIALNTPQALEQRQKEPLFNTEVGWIVLQPAQSGNGYSGMSLHEYEAVETGIPTQASGSLGPLGDTGTARVYPNVTIWFGEPNRWIVSVAVGLKTGKAVFAETYPSRVPPTLNVPPTSK
jgi:hypothetical protein